MSRVVPRASLVAYALLLSACSENARLSSRGQAVDPAVWITTDRQAARAFEGHFGSLGITALAAGGKLDDAHAQDVDSAERVAIRTSSSALPALSQLAHDELHRCGGFMLHDSEADAIDALQAETVNANTQVQARIAYTIDNGPAVGAMLPVLQEANVRRVIEDMSAFKTRFHASATGSEAATWLRDLWRAYAQNRSDIQVELIDHQKTPQPSVSLTIPGALFPDEIVVLGGHLDSTVGNRDAEAIAPGADDNASGIATLSEIARTAILLNYRPDRTVIFYGYAAEEIGLVGSGEIASSAKLAGKNVIGVMQVDMTNFTQASSPYIALIEDNTDAALNAFSAQLIEKYVGIPWKRQKCGYACSDHASWTRNGFAATYPHEATLDEGNRSIHTVRDTLALGEGNANHAMHFVKFGIAFMAEMAKGKIQPLAECSATVACAAGKACEDGKCVLVPAPPPRTGCSIEADCATGLACEAGQCVAPTGEAPDAGGASTGDTQAPTSDAGTDGLLPDAEETKPSAPGASRNRGTITGTCQIGSSSSSAEALWLLALAALLTRRTCIRMRP